MMESLRGQGAMLAYPRPYATWTASSELQVLDRNVEFSDPELEARNRPASDLNLVVNIRAS